MGLIYGLYLKISIALTFFIILILYIVKQTLNKNFKKYIKLIINKKVVILIIIAFFIGFIKIIITELNYNKYYNLVNTNQTMIGVVIDCQENDYTYMYTIKGKDNIFKNKKLLLYTSKNYVLEVGNLIKVKGQMQEIAERTNYKGFDYKTYLKTKSVFGIVKSSNIKVIKKNNINFIYKYAVQIRAEIKEIIGTNLPKDSASILTALIVGDKSNIDDDIVNNFKTSNLSHVLAISGLHISCVILGFDFIMKKIKMPFKCRAIVISLILALFITITGFTNSVVRASIMGIILLLSNVFYTKADFWTSISIAILITTFINPFSILDNGLQLSYIGTISIVCFYNIIIKLKNKKINKIKQIALTTICAQIFLMPITIIKFHTISIYFIIANILISPLISIVINLGFIATFTTFISVKFSKIFFLILKSILKILILIPNLISKLPFSKIYITNFNSITITLYYFVTILGYLYLCIKVKSKIQIRKYEKKILEKRIIEKISATCIIFIICISIIIPALEVLKQELNIYFIDVGQGDSTLIITPNKKTVLIDGGEGKNETLLSYLLNRNVRRINYMIISHFDSDHCNGMLEVIDNLKVDNLIVSYQTSECEEYRNIMEKAKSKKIKIINVKDGDIVNIDKNVQLNILYPKKELKFEDLNNNSIVFKFKYKDFSMLFTGDIEEIVENELIKIYDNELNSKVLKVAHHGSKSSSSKEFVKKVNPQIALMGVGKNNIFGHPSYNTLQTLNEYNIKIFRTDQNGEIRVNINKKGKIKIESFK